MRIEIKMIILFMKNMTVDLIGHASKSSKGADPDSAVSPPLCGAGTDGTWRNGRAIRSLYPAL